MIRVTAVQPESIAEELGPPSGHRAPLGQRPGAGGLPRLGVPHRRGRVPAARAPAGRRGDRVRHRAPARRAAGRRRSSRPGSAAAPTAATSASWTGCPTACATCSTSGTTTTGSPSATAISPRSPISSRRTSSGSSSTGSRRSTSRCTPPIPTVRRYLLRNPTAPEILPQLRHFADHGIEFHTQIVMSPGVNDGAVLRADAARAVRVRARDPGLLGGAGRAHRVQQAPPGARAHGGGVPRRDRAGRGARGDRAGGSGACTGRSAPTSCTSAPAWSCRRPRSTTAFEQVENGVGAVRWLQRRIETRRGRARRAGRAGAIGVVTGTAMAPLMPMVLEPLARATGATFELIPVVNTLFGASVTTAGLLPGAARAAGARAAGAISTWRSSPASRSTTTGSSSTA